MSNIAQPKTVLSRRRGTGLLLPQRHPPITDQAADLLADHGADDNADELQADLLGVEAEFLGEDLGDLDGEGDASPEEDHGVGAGGDEDAGLCDVG